jgi:hypothetical protein
MISTRMDEADLAGLHLLDICSTARGKPTTMPA